MTSNEKFSSRWGLIFTALGMAVGAGNLWRFPRLAGQYGGTFLILWIMFLMIWSLPILMAEFSIGKAFKKSVIGSFAQLAGKRYTWMGYFITLCALGITFYYSVVTAWGLRYLGLSLSNSWASLTGGTTLGQHIAANPNYMTEYWTQISSGSYLTTLLHIGAVLLGVAFLIRGVEKGLELANRIMIPVLFGLLILTGILAMNVGNGIKGLEYIFTVRPELFGDVNVWIEALSQSAWSTGAGWGLMMTFAAYSREKEDVTLNIFISGFGDNSASLLAGMAILPAVFALASSEAEAITFLQSGNQALVFNIVPHFFAEITGGAFLSVVFFIVFFLAAFSSLIAMIELFIKMISDMGITRKKAAITAGTFCIVLGLPSAWSLDFFNNQDWVWGIGLIVSGLFIIFAVLKFGAKKFKAQFIDQDSDFRVHNLYFMIAIPLNVVLGIILILWWMSRGYDAHPWFDENGNWNVISVYSNATIVTQWAVVLISGIVLNRFLYKKFVTDVK
ncbi:MAG: sodium-dependent transporter [Bacteroidia bacterium]|nr:sodium-dependent transporter [Bacteroidia bacterium]